MDFSGWFLDQNTKEWEEERKKVDITASMIPEYYDLGFEPWKNILHPELKKQKPNIAIEWGKEHEEKAINSFLFYHPEYLAVCPGILKKQLSAGSQIGASLDRVLWNSKDGSLINLECKCPHPLFSQLPTSPKPRVILQTLTQMWVTGIEKSIILYWQPHSFLTFEYSFDENCETLWKMVEEDIPNFKKAQETKIKRNPFKIRGLEILKQMDKIPVLLQEWREVPQHIASNVKVNNHLKMSPTVPQQM